MCGGGRIIILSWIGLYIGMQIEMCGCVCVYVCVCDYVCVFRSFCILVLDAPATDDFLNIHVRENFETPLPSLHKSPLTDNDSETTSLDLFTVGSDCRTSLRLFEFIFLRVLMEVTLVIRGTKTACFPDGSEQNIACSLGDDLTAMSK